MAVWLGGSPMEKGLGGCSSFAFCCSIETRRQERAATHTCAQSRRPFSCSKPNPGACCLPLLPCVWSL